MLQRWQLALSIRYKEQYAILERENARTVSFRFLVSIRGDRDRECFAVRVLQGEILRGRLKLYEDYFRR